MKNFDLAAAILALDDEENLSIEDYANKVRDLAMEYDTKEEQEDIISILDIHASSIPESLRTKLEAHQLYTYMDTHDLQEHVYSTEKIFEETQEEGIVINEEESNALDKIQENMDVRNCAYFRIVNL